MKYIRTFSDMRLDDFCSYCGNVPDSNDHVPSRILLEEPFPENLPTVPCCKKCNQSFSKDEEYFACILECIIHGTTNTKQLSRNKIISILNKKDKLRYRIENSVVVINRYNKFIVEEDRFKNVLIKLAKGHIKYELSEPYTEDPRIIEYKTFYLIDEKERNNFFNNERLNILPEIGSRTFQKLNVKGNVLFLKETIVQENIYRYLVYQNNNLIFIKIMIWEFLAVEIILEC